MDSSNRDPLEVAHPKVAFPLSPWPPADEPSSPPEKSTRSGAPGQAKQSSHSLSSGSGAPSQPKHCSPSLTMMRWHSKAPAQRLGCDAGIGGRSVKQVRACRTPDTAGDNRPFKIPTCWESASSKQSWRPTISPTRGFWAGRKNINHICHAPVNGHSTYAHSGPGPGARKGLGPGPRRCQTVQRADLRPYQQGCFP